MRGAGVDNAEYPYAARRSAPAVVADSSYSAFLSRQQALWLWLARLTVGAGLLAILLAICLGYIAYRAGAQALWVREVEQRGYRVTYWHELPGQTDPLPSLLRVSLGNHVCSEVSEVSFSRGWGHRGFGEPELICLACSNFPKLRSFRIDNDQFSCELIRNWPSLDRIEELDLKSAKLTDADLAVIRSMTKLKSLKLHRAKITAEGIGHLAKLQGLETLGLYSWEFTGSSEPAIQGFPALRHLEMEGSPKIGDNVIAAFGPMPELEEVIFNRTPVGDKSLARLIDGGKVRTLIMNESRVTDAGLKLVGKCAEPFSLHLAGAAVTNEGLSALAGKQIQSLVLDMTLITDEGLRSIAEIKGIGYLSLSVTKVTGAGIASLDRGVPLPRLDLEGAALTPEGVAVLAKARCTHLNLSRTFVGDKELMLFAASTDLSELAVNQTKVTVAGVRAFYRARQRLLGSMRSAEPVRLLTDFGQFVSETQAIDPLTELPIQVDAAEAPVN
jgi:hypothetical protein